MSLRIKPKEKYVRISMKEMWRNLDGPPKNKESGYPTKIFSKVKRSHFRTTIPNVYYTALRNESELVKDYVFGCQIQRWKEGNVLFNDAFNTFYLRLYGVRHMVKNHSDSVRGNPLPSHGLLFPINSKVSFICIIPQTGQHIPQYLVHQ